MQEMKTIPFFHQKNDHYCGPAVLQMILGAYGIRTSQEKLAQEIGVAGILKHGTKITILVSMLKKRGFRVSASNRKTLVGIKHAIENGSIVVVCYTEPVFEWGHYAIVKQIDAKKIILIDPDTRTGRTSMATAEFKRRWKDPLFSKTVRWAAIIQPPKKQTSSR